MTGKLLARYFIAQITVAENTAVTILNSRIETTLSLML